MPAKKTILSDAERAKRIREAAKKTGTSDDPKLLERVIRRIAIKPKHPLATKPR
jgi:hypothetical protein